jgi:hypothetical protein
MEETEMLLSSSVGLRLSAAKAKDTVCSFRSNLAYANTYVDLLQEESTVRSMKNAAFLLLLPLPPRQQSGASQALIFLISC